MAPRSRTTTLARAGLLAAAAAAAAAGGAYALTRRWDRDDDDGPLLWLPEGDSVTVTTDDGAELAVTISGSGEGSTLVLVHGWTCTSEVWGPVARRLLAADHRVVVYDQRGHGHSTFPDPAPSISRLGADLGSVLTQLDLTDVVLVGHSMGGMAVQALAVDDPALVRDRARALVLASTAAYVRGFAALGRMPARLVNATVGTRSRLGTLVMRSPFAPIGVHGFLGGSPRLRHLTTAAEMLDATDPTSRGALVHAIGRMDLREGLAKIDRPTTIVTGTRDHLIAPSCSRVMAEAIPGSRLELISGAGHMLPFEAADRLADLILDAAAAP